MSQHVAVHALPDGFRRTGVQRTDNEDLNNSGDALASVLEDKNAKVVWHVRHGQSTGNAARMTAMSADEGTGKHEHVERYHASHEYADTPLTELGKDQARKTAVIVASWAVKPTLVVCSALTRAIQTAALIFCKELLSGVARLVIRPEMREFWPDNIENSGRTRKHLRACTLLQELEAWQIVELALSDAATVEWGKKWDEELANGPDGQWQAHCGGGERICAFRKWLATQREQQIAVVSHIGAINNLLNREPWTQVEDVKAERTVIPTWLPAAGWPTGGILRRFGVSNAGWVAVSMTMKPVSENDDAQDGRVAKRVRSNLRQELARLEARRALLFLLKDEAIQQ